MKKKLLRTIFLLLISSVFIYSCTDSDDSSSSVNNNILQYKFSIGNVSRDDIYEIEIDINGEKEIIKSPSLGYRKILSGDYKLEDTTIKVNTKSNKDVSIYYEVINNIKNNKDNFISGGLYKNNFEKFIKKSDFNRTNIKKIENLTSVSFHFNSIYLKDKNITIEVEGNKYNIKAPNSFVYFSTTPFNTSNELNIKVKYPTDYNQGDYNGYFIVESDNYNNSFNLNGDTNLDIDVSK